MAKKENNMYKKIDGIIVSEYPFEESSKIINILLQVYLIFNIKKKDYLN